MVVGGALYKRARRASPEWREARRSETVEERETERQRALVESARVESKSQSRVKNEPLLSLT